MCEYSVAHATFVCRYAGLSFATFETLKATYREKKGYDHDSDIPTPYRLMFGGSAALFAQSMTYPLDLVRRRMQVALPGDAIKYRSAFDAMATIAREEGAAGAATSTPPLVCTQEATQCTLAKCIKTQWAPQ
jgi:hypothetical protein